MANYPFTAQKIESFSELPPGPYICKITKTDVLKTREGTGRYVLVVFEIIEGQYKGRKIFQNFNTLNKNPIAVEIGKKHLSLLCSSLGMESFDDTDELLHKQTIIKVGLQNKLYGFKSIEENIAIDPMTALTSEKERKDEAGFKDDDIPF